MTYRFLSLVITFGLLTGCSRFVQKTAVNTTGSLMAESADEMKGETSWKFFSQATPANLKMVEGLLFVNPENEDILLTLTKGFSAYSFGFYETQFLEEKYQDAEIRPALTETKYAYSKALRYGERWFAVRGLPLDNLLKISNEEGAIAKKLSAEFDSESKADLEGVFFTAQAWAGLINLSMTDPQLLSQFVMVKELIDWVCKAKPNFENGACDIFYGAYYASRPKMLGGDIDKGLTYFRDGMRKYPDNLLIRVSFLQFYAIPFEEEGEFDKQAKVLKMAARKFQESQLFRPGRSDKEWSNQLNLMNAIALERYKIMEKYRKELF